jgi:hypothetical protein
VRDIRFDDSNAETRLCRIKKHRLILVWRGQSLAK